MTTDPILLEYWGSANFRGIHHCPICLERKPCPCDQLAPPEPVATIDDNPPAGDRWLHRRDLA